ncbi:phage head-tail joining protein [Phenylobacterium sp.]|uniref:phage head-tail joining protein n=1 Tax=Phenylobacterium sp. TaxID=1871053 RepID=UPI0035B22E0B
MATLAQLQDWRESLLAARMRGVRSLRDQNGEEVTFSSDREMAAAIAACDREIAGLTSTAPKTIIFRTTKGL